MGKQKKQDGLYWHKKLVILRKKQITVNKQEDKRDHFSSQISSEYSILPIGKFGY